MSAARQTDNPEWNARAGAAVRLKLTDFMRLLRDNHFAVGMPEARDALNLIEAGYAVRPGSLRVALRALFCARRADWDKFEELFDAHWLGAGMRGATVVSGSPQKAPAGMKKVPGFGDQQQGAGGLPDHVKRGSEEEEAASGGEGTRGGASRGEVLETTDLRHVAEPDAIAEVNELAERLARRMRYRLSRRERQRRKGRRIDLRATIRRSVARGGAPVDLAWRKRREKPLRIVAILDVSSSMSQYSAFFLRFLHGILDHMREAEAFLFHTRLVHVSPALREKDPQKALDRLSLVAQGFAGGTKIGESLATFNRMHAARVVHGRTAVIIMSDGYDTGGPDEIGRELAALRKRTKRIVWLNPMAGWNDYQPVAGGMSAAMPHLDLFAPAHNLASLAALEPYLARI